MGFPGYIRVEKDKPQDPKIYDVVDRLLAAGVTLTVERRLAEGNGAGDDIPESVAREVLRNAILGGIVTLWCYADRHIRDANVLPMGLQGASQVTGLPVGWLRLLPKEWLTANDDGSVSLPNYRQHNHVIPKAERDGFSASPSAIRMRRMRRKRRASQERNGDVTRDASRDAPPVPVPVPSPYTRTGTSGDTEKSASSAAPSRRAATPRKKPAVPWQPPATESTWESWSAPAKPKPPHPPRTEAEVERELEAEWQRRFGPGLTVKPETPK